MSVWFAVVAGLLPVSGYAKLSNPAPTVGALDAAGLPSGRSLVVVLGWLEIAAGIAGLTLTGAIGGIPVALLYAGFTVFVVLALVRHWPVQSCGCLARIDTPPSWIHVVFDGAAVAGAMWQVATRAPSPVATAVDLGAWGAAYVAAVIVGVVLAQRLVFVLPIRLHPRSPQRA